MNQLLRIATHVLNTPLLIHPAKAQVILGVLSSRIGVGGVSLDFDPTSPEASRFVGSSLRGDGRRSMVRAKNGVGIITIDGTLVNRGAFVGSYSGETSYEGISAQLDEAANDPDIKAVLLDINSPGGEALGMTGVAQKVRELRNAKPVTAVVNDMAASAAYGIASAANEIIVSPTSMTGSIGVVMLHADHSAELAEKGIKPTLIFAGDHKVDANPFGPLPDEVKKDLQASVDLFYAKFLSAVAEGRGHRLTAEMARATQAKTFIGEEAIGVGLADRVATFDQILSELENAPRMGGTNSNRRLSMSKETNQPAAEAGTADIDAARNDGIKIGTQQERARISAILGSEEAKGREPAATSMALDTNMSADEAKKVLATLPKSGTGGIAARAQNLPEAGSENQPAAASRETAAAGWGKAVKSVNARIAN